ncbi:MAG: hypothetical protein HQ559_04275 [Lentisphaerae bacterium]|nr:hypothetical protein [Lentisphaerota bacterium]
MRNGVRLRDVTLLAALLVRGVAAAGEAETHVNGFAGFVTHSHAANFFRTHRGANTEAGYLFTRSGDEEIVWKSANVPTSLAERVVFAWDATMSGLHHLSGQYYAKKEPFIVDLYMNDRELGTFPLALKGDARFVLGKEDESEQIVLTFDYLSKDWIGNLNGIMYLSVPASMVTPGRQVAFKAVGRPHIRGAFYGVIKLKDTWRFAATVRKNPKETELPDKLRKMSTAQQPEEVEAVPEKVAEQSVEPLLPDPRRSLHVVLISGLTGNAEEKALIEKKLGVADSLFRRKLGYPPEHIHVLADRDTAHPKKRADTSLENIRRLFEELGAKLRSEDALLLMLVGHANRVGERVMFNIRGKDLEVDDLPGLFAGIRCENSMVWVFTPLSGAFIKPLSRPGRVILTSCRDDQIYRTALAMPFLEAFGFDETDVDNNGLVSVLESFRYSVQRVKETFDARVFKQTEQGLLDGDGDGRGSATPSHTGPDGRLAARWFLSAP